MKLDVDGKLYEFDHAAVTVKQAVIIEKHIGGTITDWETGLIECRTPCIQALGWYLFEHANPDVAVDDVDFPVTPLAAAYLIERMKELEDLKGELEKLAQENEADPTQPPGGQQPTPATSLPVPAS